MTLQNYRGTIKLIYYNRTIEFPYSMTNLGGSPHIYFNDKDGRHHSFHYNDKSKRWVYGYNRGPFWRKDFMDVLYVAMDLERERHGL